VGTGEQIRAVGETLMTAEDLVVELSTAGVESPHGSAVARLRVASDANPGMVISRHGDEVTVLGERASRLTLAENLIHFGEDPIALGGHLHIEHFPGHFYLRDGSVPLVVEAR
jgi:hypothetical protein